MKKLVFLFVVAMIAAPSFGDLVAYYNFNDGTATDQITTGGQQNGTLMGGVTIVERGTSKAASFDGQWGSFIDCGFQLPKIYNTTTAYTVSAWVKSKPKVAGPTESADQWPVIAGNGWVFNNLMCTMTGGTAVSFMIGVGPNNIAAAMPVGEWTMLTATYEVTGPGTGNALLYVNGTLASSAATTGDVWGSGGAQHFTIGSMYGWPVAYATGAEYKGYIDEVRWYNNAVSPDDVEALYFETYIPEPCTLALLGLGGLLLRRKA